MILDVLKATGIMTSAGIGTNLYLALPRLVVMDIQANHTPVDQNGVQVAELDEMSYCCFLWLHRPLTDLWRIGKGYAKKIEERGFLTMDNIARCSIVFILK